MENGLSLEGLVGRGREGEAEAKPTGLPGKRRFPTVILPLPNCPSVDSQNSSEGCLWGEDGQTLPSVSFTALNGTGTKA